MEKLVEEWGLGHREKHVAKSQEKNRRKKQRSPIATDLVQNRENIWGKCKCGQQRSLVKVREST